MKRIAEVGLMFAAMFWGASGILTQIALKDMSPMTLIGYRFLLATVIGWIIFRIKPKNITKHVLKHSAIMSFLLMVIFVSSTIGLKYTSASNAGFILGSTVVLVPIINWLLYKKGMSKREIACTILCFIGLGLVTLKSVTGINKGDLLCFIDAVAYSFYIIYGSKIDQKTDVRVLSVLQYAFVSIFAVAYVMIFETMAVTWHVDSGIAMVLMSVACTLLAFLLQNHAQKYTSPERTSRILTLIPIFSMLFDFMYFKVHLSAMALLGGTLIVLANLLVETKKKMKLEVS